MDKRNSIEYKSPLIYDKSHNTGERALLAAMMAFLITPSAIEVVNNYQTSHRDSVPVTYEDDSVVQPIFRGSLEDFDTLVFSPDGKKLFKNVNGANVLYGFNNTNTNRLEINVPSSNEIASFLDTTYDNNHFVTSQVWRDTNGLPRTEVVYNDDHSLKSIILYNFKGQPSFRKNFKDGEIVADPIVMKSYPDGKVMISKIDVINGQELPGATLVLTGPDGFEEKWDSVDKPHLLKNLNPGNYKLTELMPADGHILNKDNISFTVDENGKIVTFTAINDGVRKTKSITNEDEKIEEENVAIIARLNLKVDENHQIIYDESGKICGYVEVIEDKNTITKLGKNGEIIEVVEKSKKKEIRYNYAGKAGEEGIASYVAIEYGDNNFVKHAECITTNGLPLCEADYNGESYVLKLYDVYGTSVYATIKHTEDENEIIDEEINENGITTKRIVYNKNDNTIFSTIYSKDGSKDYEYTRSNNVENGVSYFGKAGSEKVMSAWMIEYWEDGITNKYQFIKDVDENPVRYIEYDEKGNPILNIEWDSDGKPVTTLGNSEDAVYLRGLLGNTNSRTKVK